MAQKPFLGPPPQPHGSMCSSAKCVSAAPLILTLNFTSSRHVFKMEVTYYDKCLRFKGTVLLPSPVHPEGCTTITLSPSCLCQSSPQAFYPSVISPSLPSSLTLPSVSLGPVSPGFPSVGSWCNMASENGFVRSARCFQGFFTTQHSSALLYSGLNDAPLARTSPCLSVDGHRDCVHLGSLGICV